MRRCRGLLFWASRFSLAELAQKGRAAAAAELLVGFPKPPPQPWEAWEACRWIHTARGAREHGT